MHWDQWPWNQLAMESWSVRMFLLSPSLACCCSVTSRDTFPAQSRQDNNEEAEKGGDFHFTPSLYLERFKLVTKGCFHRLDLNTLFGRFITLKFWSFRVWGFFFSHSLLLSSPLYDLVSPSLSHLPYKAVSSLFLQEFGTFIC